MRIDGPFPRDDARKLCEGSRNDQSIHRRHQVIALGDGDERHGIDDPRLLVDHAHQQFLMAFAFAGCRHCNDVLRVQAETVVVQRPAQPPHPIQLALPRRHVTVCWLVDMDAIATFLLRDIAGIISRAHQLEQSRDCHRETRPGRC